MQVKSLILVGTLEKYQFLILMTPKAFLICGLGDGRTTHHLTTTRFGSIILSVNRSAGNIFRRGSAGPKVCLELKINCS
ncbi:hypothetical protein BUQ74_08310 [Leptospira weilii serovar Heyan]|nr:hypothetical protein BUQ74_08310 [Leptospira weilii serovar Heyan]